MGIDVVASVPEGGASAPGLLIAESVSRDMPSILPHEARDL
jgi:hypothetical protein